MCWLLYLLEPVASSGTPHQCHTLTTALYYNSSQYSTRCKYLVILIFSNAFPEHSSDWSNPCVGLLSSSGSPIGSCHTCTCMAPENCKCQERDTSTFLEQGQKFLALSCICAAGRCSNITDLPVFSAKCTLLLYNLY